MRHRVSKRLFSWAAVTVAASVLAFGCSSSTSPTTGSIAGTYTLSKVDGNALPVVIDTSGGVSTSITQGTVTLTTTTFLAGLTANVTTNGTTITQAEGDTGTYTLTGSSLTISSHDSSTNTGTISGNNLTISAKLGGGSSQNDGGNNTVHTLLFVKQ